MPRQLVQWNDLSSTRTYPTATDSLRPRISAIQELIVVFGGDDCFRCSDNFFVENWSDIFVPARDDAMANRLNARPRKTLDYDSPAQRFERCVAMTD